MKQNLVNERETILFGNDSIVIRKYNSGIEGGRSLNVEGFTEKTIPAGTVIITKDGDYKPLPISDGSYAALPSGWAYAGLLYRTIRAARPFASIMFDGVVNSTLLPAPLPAAFISAFPNIVTIKDEEA